jgi:hypothetical protein
MVGVTGNAPAHISAPNRAGSLSPSTPRMTQEVGTGMDHGCPWHRSNPQKIIGHPGAAPGVSRPPAERIAVFLVPAEIGGATENCAPIFAMPLRCLPVGPWPRRNWWTRTRVALAPEVCRTSMLLLHYRPKKWWRRQEFHLPQTPCERVSPVRYMRPRWRLAAMLRRFQYATLV